MLTDVDKPLVRGDENLHSFRIYIAFAFLMLFTRVMVPDEVVLALHFHDHTEHALPDADYKVDTEHQHCHIDKLYSSDFTSPEFSFELIKHKAEVCYLQPYSFAWKFTYPNNTYLRGPPIA